MQRYTSFRLKVAMKTCFFYVLFILSIATYAKEGESQSSADTLYTVKLKNGQTLTGRLKERSDTLIILETDHAETRIKPEGVESIVAEDKAHTDNMGKFYFEDPNSSRYLFAPSAFMLKKKEMKLSQHEIFFTNFSAGITDYLSLQAGTAVPFWFIEAGEGINFLLALKGGGQIAPRFNLAGGIEIFALPAQRILIGLPFVTSTFGNYNYHISVSGSAPFLVFEGDGNIGDFYWFTICGFARLGTHIGLVTENWIFKIPLKEYSNSVYVVSLAARLFGNKFSSDLGLLFHPEMAFPPPWVSFTFHIK